MLLFLDWKNSLHGSPVTGSHTHIQGFDLYLEEKNKNNCLKCKDALLCSDKVPITTLIAAAEKGGEDKCWHTADFAEACRIHVYLLFLQTFIIF